jgi:hypothetical protein
MAPEQAAGGAIDGRADLFAVGIVLWELITGTRLFKGPTGRVVQAVWGKVPPVARVVEGVDPALNAIIVKALERDPERRFRSAEEMRVALEQYVRALPEPVGQAEVAHFVTLLFEDAREETRRLIESRIEHAALSPERMVIRCLRSIRPEEQTESAAVDAPQDPPAVAIPAPSVAPPPVVGASPDFAADAARLRWAKRLLVPAVAATWIGVGFGARAIHARFAAASERASIVASAPHLDSATVAVAAPSAPIVALATARPGDPAPAVSGASGVNGGNGPIAPSAATASARASTASCPRAPRPRRRMTSFADPEIPAIR